MGTFLLVALTRPDRAEAKGDDTPVAQTFNERQSAFARDLETLALWAQKRGLTTRARQTRLGQLPLFSDKHVLIRLPSTLLPTNDAAGETKENQWWTRFAALREQHAAAFFELLPQAVKQQQVTTAFQIIYTTLRTNPNHAAARQLLGHEQHEGRWYPAATVRRLQNGEVWHDRFGWLPEEQVARYEKGERLYRGRWLSAEREAETRNKISRGWQIETDHFEVKTNHSLASGVQLASQLEQLYNAWYQLFPAYHTSAAELKKLVRTGKPSRRTTIRHKVVYFGSRDEYVRRLAKQQRGIEGSLGIYLSKDRTAYFFAGDDQDPGTVLHEATHQLFQEASASRKQIAKQANIWIVEGIACYMESLRTGRRSSWGGYDTVGGYGIARLPGARIRLLEDQFYVPLAELTRLGGPTLQRHPRVATIYTQSAGQAAFLMHYADGRYREPLVTYLKAIYSNRAKADTLSELTGEDFEILDQEYRQFLIGADAASEKRAGSPTTSGR